MKVLLAAVNARYNHTNIAVRSIALYSGNEDVSFEEYTINQNINEILWDIYSKKPDMVIFSCYIWNIELIKKIIPNVKRILENAVIGCGGPEVSFDAEGYLKSILELDFVICGEGEETFREILEKNDYRDIAGIAFRNQKSFTPRKLIENIDTLPFPYEKITEPDNKIHYYESSRGCPFSCSYCMSSIDTLVRFKSMSKVFEELQIFLDSKVKLVKFVDRTYNLNEERYLAIWRYIVEHHNGKTMFHFEIEAEFLGPKALEFLETVPEGIMQFEIGVQTSNKNTLKSINRSANIEKLSENIKKIPKTIHKHLDLIAGLPEEDMESFGKSFDFVMGLKPDALQLGFLKILYGTEMKKLADKSYKYLKSAPYEVLSTPYMSYDDIKFLKDLEILLDTFYNSHHFDALINHACSNGCWKFFESLTKFGQKIGAFTQARNEGFWIDFMHEFVKEDIVLNELLRFDYIKFTKRGAFPSWYVHNYSKEGHTESLKANGGIKNARLDYAHSDYEEFSINPLTLEKTRTKMLFKYETKELIKL